MKDLFIQPKVNPFIYKMNGIKIIDSFAKMFCPIQIGRTRPKLAGQIAEQTASRRSAPPMINPFRLASRHSLYASASMWRQRAGVGE